MLRWASSFCFVFECVEVFVGVDGVGVGLCKYSRCNKLQWIHYLLKTIKIRKRVVTEFVFQFPFEKMHSVTKYIPRHLITVFEWFHSGQGKLLWNLKQFYKNNIFDYHNDTYLSLTIQLFITIHKLLNMAWSI